MRFLFYFLLFRLLGNPFLALLLILFIYLMVDRQFIGLLPDIFKPLKRNARIKNLKEQIKLNPANVDAYKELGVLYLERKKYKEAIQYLEKTLEKLGQYADVHFYLGKAYYLIGKTEEGINELQKAVNINTKIGYGEPFVYLLDGEINNGRDITKIDDIITNLERFGTPEILYKGGTYLKLYDQKRARMMFKEAVETYKASPKHFKKTHRRWALLAKLQSLA